MTFRSFRLVIEAYGLWPGDRASFPSWGEVEITPEFVRRVDMMASIIAQHHFDAIHQDYPIEWETSSAYGDKLVVLSGYDDNPDNAVISFEAYENGIKGETRAIPIKILKRVIAAKESGGALPRGFAIRDGVMFCAECNALEAVIECWEGGI